jgi:hypothetical protein
MNGDAASSTDAIGGVGSDFDVAARSAPPTESRAAQLWARIERKLVYAGDWLNPILVKETRQALKSFQFTTTFVLVLAFCWVVTIGGLAWIGPSIFYSSSGGVLLAWYYGALALALVVVVPFSAFRSLISEREDNTYELLSITALRPRQIISGKLGSAIVQMAVYFSAITPCFAFTYLLRGVDLPTIAALMAYTFLGSLGLSMAGILLATLSQQRFAQVFMSVALVAALLLICGYSIVGAYMMIQYSWAMFGGSEFWTVNNGLATIYVTTFALMYFAAAAMITFCSENRSSALRICMLVQQAAWIGWMAYFWIRDDYHLQAIHILATMAAIYWYAMGAMMTSEQEGMSQRVRRRLPKSFLGRMFLSWFNPGPATGYMFAVANGSAIVAICLIGMKVADNRGTRGGWPSASEMLFALVVGLAYGIAYLGIGKLVISLLRRVAHVNMFAGVLIHFLVILAGCGIPTTIQLMSVDLRMLDYTYWQIFNPVWSLAYLMDNGVPAEGPVLILLVPAAAVCVLLLNLRSIVRELQDVRVTAPKRVLQDEAELHPAPAPTPQNPWEEVS